MKFHARPHPGPTAVELSEMDTSGRSRSVRRRRLPAPTGLRLKAQGCRAAATLGILATERPTPTGLSQGKRTRRHNPFGVVDPSTRLPRVGPLRGPTLGWRTQPRWGTIGGCSLIQRRCSPALPRGKGGVFAAVGRNGAVRRLERLERGNAKSGARAFTPRRHDLPLPGGEGWAEGERISARGLRPRTIAMRPKTSRNGTYCTMCGVRKMTNSVLLFDSNLPWKSFPSQGMSAISGTLRVVLEVLF